MLEAAQRQDVAPGRVSFADALTCMRFGNGEIVKLQANPLREDRIEPRVVKRRNKPFATMSKPRKQLRQMLLANHSKNASTLANCHWARSPCAIFRVRHLLGWKAHATLDYRASRG